MIRPFTVLPALACLFFIISCTTTEQKSAANLRTTKSNFSKPSNSKFNAKRRTVRTTAYSHMENEPGAYGKLNAIGTTLRYGRIRSAAADWSRYPLGTQFKIVGQPHLYEIDDYGSALVGTETIDLYKPTLGLMNQWGVKHVDIEIVKWGSYERSAEILSKRCKYSHCRCMYHDLQSKVKRQTTNPGPFCRLCPKP